MSDYSIVDRFTLAPIETPPGEHKMYKKTEMLTCFRRAIVWQASLNLSETSNNWKSLGSLRRWLCNLLLERFLQQGMGTTNTSSSQRIQWVPTLDPAASQELHYLFLDGNSKLLPGTRAYLRKEYKEDNPSVQEAERQILNWILVSIYEVPSYTCQWKLRLYFGQSWMLTIVNFSCEFRGK